MNTWVESTSEKLISSDMYSIVHDLRDPVDSVESNSKCEQRDQISFMDNVEPGVSQFLHA